MYSRTFCSSSKDAHSKLSLSRVVYKFSCAGCGASNVAVGETNRHLATRVRENLHPIRTRTSFSTFMGQKHVELCAQRIAFPDLGLRPRLFN